MKDKNFSWILCVKIRQMGIVEGWERCIIYQADLRNDIGWISRAIKFVDWIGQNSWDPKRK